MGNLGGGGSNGGGDKDIPGRPPIHKKPTKKKKDITDRYLGLRIIKGAGEALEKRAYASNLKSRKKFVKKLGLTKDDMRMDDAYLGSKTGLAELRKQGYKTNQDIIAESQLREGPTPGGEQPRAASQMDNKDVKSKMIIAKGPTDIEMTEDERLLKIKRRGRKRTTLTNLTEEEKPSLSKRVLLGN